jgi:hypothetical protein
LLRHGMSGNCNFSKDNLAGIKLTSLRRSQGWDRHRISMGIVRRISTVSAGDCAGKMASFRWPTSFCQPGTTGLANFNNIEANSTLFALKSACDSTSQYNDYLATPCRSLSHRHSTPQPGAKTPPLSLPSSPPKADQPPRIIRTMSEN